MSQLAQPGVQLHRNLGTVFQHDAGNRANRNMKVRIRLVDKYKRAIYYIDLPILQKDHGDAIFEWNVKTEAKSFYYTSITVEPKIAKPHPSIWLAQYLAVKDPLTLAHR